LAVLPRRKCDRDFHNSPAATPRRVEHVHIEIQIEWRVPQGRKQVAMKQLRLRVDLM
jgi:hypothetical protein